MSSNNSGPLRLTTPPPASLLLKFPCDILTDILLLLLVEDLLKLEQSCRDLNNFIITHRPIWLAQFRSLPFAQAPNLPPHIQVNILTTAELRQVVVRAVRAFLKIRSRKMRIPTLRMDCTIDEFCSVFAKALGHSVHGDGNDPRILLLPGKSVRTFYLIVYGQDMFARWRALKKRTLIMIWMLSDTRQEHLGKYIQDVETSAALESVAAEVVGDGDTVRILLCHRTPSRSCFDLVEMNLNSISDKTLGTLKCSMVDNISDPIVGSCLDGEYSAAYYGTSIKIWNWTSFVAVTLQISEHYRFYPRYVAMSDGFLVTLYAARSSKLLTCCYFNPTIAVPSLSHLFSRCTPKAGGNKPKRSKRNRRTLAGPMFSIQSVATTKILEPIFYYQRVYQDSLVLSLCSLRNWKLQDSIRISVTAKLLYDEDYQEIVMKGMTDHFMLSSALDELNGCKLELQFEHGPESITDGYGWDHKDQEALQVSRSGRALVYGLGGFQSTARNHRTAALCACSSCFDWTKTYAKKDRRYNWYAALAPPKTCAKKVWGYNWYYAALAPLLGEQKEGGCRHTASLEPYSGAIYYYVSQQQKVVVDLHD